MALQKQRKPYRPRVKKSIKRENCETPENFKIKREIIDSLDDEEEIDNEVLPDKKGVIVELTKTDIRNGWTAETLAKYHKDREEISLKKILEPRIVKPDTQERYNPLRWRES